MRAIGADTLRLGVQWDEVAPRAESGRRPQFDATDPDEYPGFTPYDDVVRRATDKGFRVLLDLGPDAPRWATSDGAPLGPETGNREPDPVEFARFAAAVGKRYSGDFEGLPKVEWFSLWNEPNHHFFLKPNGDAPRIYRQMVAVALPALRDAAGEDVHVLAGETAPIRRPGSVLGPRDFLQRWLCLDKRFRPTPDEKGCRGFQGFDVDGYAHHPYGPASSIPKHADVISLLAIARLGRYLDRAAEAGRLPRGLPIYSTEFGFQSNPPDPTARNTLGEQAALLNEKELQTYRYPRLRSYAQYLLYDDSAREGITLEQVWSGFQTGLRFADGEAKPAYDAYRFPIVVERSSSDSVSMWGRVRPGSGARSVELQYRRGGRFRPTGGRIDTDDAGYFEQIVLTRAPLRFRAYDSDGRLLGTSRVAAPLRP
jgi:Cellulase (glycosyl hydrolase family 5)